MPLEQVNIQVSGVSGWFRPINVTVFLNSYPVPSQVYDAGSMLYVSFLMPYGKPENLSLRVIAWDCNRTHAADSTATVKRVESSEAANIRMLMGNLTAVRTKIDSLTATLNTVAANLNAVITSLNAISKLGQETKTLLTSVNGSVTAKISNVAFDLSREIDVIQEVLSTLKVDAEDVKTIATGINEATHSGNVIVANLQSQVAWLQKTVYAVTVLSSLSLVLVAVLIYRSKKASAPLKQPLQTASWRSVRKEDPSEPKQLEPMSKERKLIRRIT